jgi:hypothetical protein
MSPAGARVSGWENHFMVDDALRHTNNLRKPLAPSASRLVQSAHVDEIGIPIVALGPVDEKEHNFTLKLDAKDDVPWQRNVQRQWDMRLMFCTEDLIQQDRCRIYKIKTK